MIKSHSIKGYRCDARKALSKEDMMRLKSSVEPSERRRGKTKSRYYSGLVGVKIVIRMQLLSLFYGLINSGMLYT